MCINLFKTKCAKDFVTYCVRYKHNNNNNVSYNNINNKIKPVDLKI